MSLLIRALAMAALLAAVMSAPALADPLQVRGTALNLPLPTSCPATSPVVYSFGGSGVVLTFACNGIQYACNPLPLSDGSASSMTIGVPSGAASQLQVRCGPGSAIVGLQTYIHNLFPDLATYEANPTANQPDKFCLAVALRALSAISYEPNMRRYAFTCADTPSGAKPETVSCFTVTDFSYDVTNTTLMMPRCIDATNPLNSPIVFRDNFDD